MYMCDERNSSGRDQRQSLVQRNHPTLGRSTTTIKVNMLLTKHCTIHYYISARCSLRIGDLQLEVLLQLHVESSKSSD